jgi:hypothetical protein
MALCYALSPNELSESGLSLLTSELLDFNVVSINATSSSLLTISNPGGIDVLIPQAPVITGADADRFTFADNEFYPLTVSAGTQVTYEIHFTPTTVGHRIACFSFYEQNNNNPHNVELHGYGYAPDGNDTSQTATEFTPYFQDVENYPAIIEPIDDVDWYVFWQMGPAIVDIHTEHIEDSTVDLSAYLYGPYEDINIAVPDSSFIYFDDNSWSDGINPCLEALCEDSGFYYLRIARSDNSPDSTRAQRWETNDYSLWVSSPYIPFPWEADPPTDLEATVLYRGIRIDWDFPEYLLYGLAGFNVYRDDVMLNTEYVDTFYYYDLVETLIPGQTYEYKVTSNDNFYYNESAPSDSILVTYSASVFGDDFESYPDFTNQFGDWINDDEDGGSTFNFYNGIDFPGEGNPHSFIIFNPSATVPPLSSADAFNGNKFAAAICNVSEPSSNWLITPLIQLSDAPASVEFLARSYLLQFGPELIEVAVSNGSSDLDDFTVISGEEPIEVPLDWTLYHYELDAYANQPIRVAVHSLAQGTFIFMLDEFSIINEGGTVSLEESFSNPLENRLASNYPNPFNPETEICFELKEASDVTIDVFNIKGQMIRRIAQDQYAGGVHRVVWDGKDTNRRPVSSGVYFYRMKAGTYTRTRKMILMK